MTNYPIGAFQDRVLRALLVKNGQSYVREIDEFLTSQEGEGGDQKFLTPQVQLAIKRLEQRGLVIFLRKEKPDAGGNWRRIYAITAAGREAVTNLENKPDKERSQIGYSPGVLAPQQ